MNADHFAEWFRLRGRRVVRTASSYWHTQGPRIYQAFPYHWVIAPSEEEVHRLLKTEKGIGLCYSTPLHAAEGMISYHVMLSDPEYALARLPRKPRYRVTRCLREATIEPISLRRLADEGWGARAETLRRQGRVGAEKQDGWERLCHTAAQVPGFEAWGVFVAGELAASLLAFTCDDWFNILYQQSRTAYLRLGVNNALAVVVSQEVMQRPSIDCIFYGLHSLDAPPSVDEFKFGIEYTAKPVRQRVVFHSRLAPFFNGPTYALLSAAQRGLPGQPTLAKAEGMVRFYRQGKQPLSEQSWPACLESYKGEGSGLEEPEAVRQAGFEG